MSDQQDIFLGRQPILDRNQTVVAYELLFRSGSRNSADVVDDLQATAKVIMHAFADLDVATVLGKKPGFINVSADLLLSDLIEFLPKDKVVIELLETIEIDNRIVDRCRELKAAGFRLALDDVDSAARCEPLRGIVEVVKFDMLLFKPDALKGTVQELKRWPVKLLAEKIDDQEQAHHCHDLGFDLFQGYYFARPAILTGKKTSPAKLALLKLLGLVLGEGETGEIEQAMKHDPGLSYNLLRLVNSAAYGTSHKISSLKQAIVVLGRRQLQRWLQLLLFVNTDGQGQNPLLELAAGRGKLMELLAIRLMANDKAYQDRAFITGILSLLEALLGMPFQEIATHLNLANDVHAALEKREGDLGKLLALIENLEKSDFEAVAVLLAPFPLSLDDLTQAQMEAMRWATAVSEAA